MVTIVRVVSITLVGSLAFGASKLSSDLPATTPNGMLDVIVQYKSFAGAESSASIGRGRIHRHFRSIPAVHMTVPVSMLQSLAANPQVAYISPNRKTSSFLDITTQTVHANTMWSSGWDGAGVGVAVIDSGVALKPDLATADGSQSRVVFSESFVAGEDASDDYGHGTHVAGIVAANGSQSSGPNFTHTFKGVAPGANIVNLRVLDGNGNGQESDVIAALDEAIALQSTYNIRVINLSLGHPVYESFLEDPLCQAVEAAWKAGIAVVVAAGNMGRDNSLGTEGYGTITSPGNDPYVITVGAMNANGTPWRSDDTIASYSSKGPTLLDHVVKPDLVAPGNNVVSLLASPNCTLAAEYPDTLISTSTYENSGQGLSSDYFMLSGTSMATPVVSGAAALMLEEDPSLTPDEIKARLMKTASKQFGRYTSATDLHRTGSFQSQQDIFAVGAGYLDIERALTNTDPVDFQALSPVAQYDAQTQTVTLASADAIIWGSSVPSPNAIIWGSSTNLWSDAIIWGSSIVSDDAIIWGSSIPWGDPTVGSFAII
ncbi:MAG: S8 family peptidase, partial [Bryobacterales bacterium]|nr:S8 family peptidase [Bryobacterales bacterium]